MDNATIPRFVVASWTESPPSPWLSERGEREALSKVLKTRPYCRPISRANSSSVENPRPIIRPFLIILGPPCHDLPPRFKEIHKTIHSQASAEVSAVKTLPRPILQWSSRLDVQPSPCIPRKTYDFPPQRTGHFLSAGGDMSRSNRSDVEVMGAQRAGNGPGARRVEAHDL